MNARAKFEKSVYATNNIPHSQPIPIPISSPAENDLTQSPQDYIDIGSPPRESWLSDNAYFTGKPSKGYRQLLFSPKAVHMSKSLPREDEDSRLVNCRKL